MMKLAHALFMVLVVTTLTVFSVGAVPYNVLQATDTPTPVNTSTITAAPGFVPTIQATQELNLECNAGTPIGWGTTTPDAVWSVLCSQCMVTAFPSGTPSPTSTAPTPTGTLPTASPTITVTPTSTLIPAISCNGNTSLLTCSQLNLNTIRLDVIGNPFNEDIAYNATYSTTGAAHFYFQMHWQYSAWVDVFQTEAVSHYVRWGHHFIDGGRVFNDGGVGEACEGSPNDRCGDFPTGDFFHDYLYTSGDRTIGWIRDGIDNNFFWTPQEAWMVISTTPINPTPTPTVTGTPAFGYCQAVNGGGVVPDTGFEWNGIVFGSTACFDIGPIEEWDFGFLVINVNIPWIAHLCLTNIDLGVITAFGVQISLLAITYVLGVAWAIRNMFVS